MAELVDARDSKPLDASHESSSLSPGTQAAQILPSLKEFSAQGVCGIIPTMITATLKKDIAKMARASVHEAVRAEMMHLRASALPLVPMSEQREIVRKYKKPVNTSARKVRANF